MKKILPIVLVLAILFGFAACGEKSPVDETVTATFTAEISTTTECFHSWTNATCTEGKTCTMCGEVISSPLGHNFGHATCTSPSTCTACGETTGEALGHQYLKGLCVRCNAKDSSYVAYGTIQGTISYKHNDFVGHKGDTGATVMLIPYNQRSRLEKYDNSRAAIGITGKYESGIMVTECDGNGFYIFDNVPAGYYLIFVISKNTTDDRAFDNPSGYKDMIANTLFPDVPQKDIERITILIGAHKYIKKVAQVTENSTFTFSYDFGETFY